MKTPISILLRWLAAAALLLAHDHACAHTIRSFPAGEGGWQLAAPVVGNVDDDAELEIIVAYRTPSAEWLLDGYNPDGSRLPGFPFSGGAQPINATPTLADINNDRRAEIIFTCGRRVMALDGRNGSIIWQDRVDPENYQASAGYQVATNGFYWTSDRLLHPRLSTNALFYSEVSPPLVADFDGNGSLEVATAWKIDPDSSSSSQDFNPFIMDLFGFGDWGAVGEVWSGGVIFHNAATGARNFVYHFHQLVEAGLAAGQLDDDLALEVMVLNDSDSVAAFDKTQPCGLFGNGMLHKQFGKNQRFLSGSYLTGVDVYAADVDGDGRDEVLVPTTQFQPLWQPSETLLDDDGAILWRKWKHSVDLPTQHGWFNSASMIPVNPDRDNHVDILVVTHSHELAFRWWNGVEFADHAGWPKNFAPRLPTPPVVGDINGDGEEEIIVGTCHPGANPSSGSIQVFALDGRELENISVPGGVKHIPSLADVDQDGSLDLIWRSLEGRIYIANFGARPGASVSWAAHRGNGAHDGNRTVSLSQAGAPVVFEKEAGHRSARFRWRTPSSETPRGFAVYRAALPQGPFQHIVTLSSNVREFTDSGLEDGWLYFYEVEAIYASYSGRSAPFALLSFLNGNKVSNAGFEEDDDSHWDKWFTGDIPIENMTGSPSAPYQGRQSMSVWMMNHGSNSSISQYRQYGTPDAYLAVTPGKLYSFGGFMRSDALSRSSRHWLEWNSTATGEDFAPRPPLPWPNYFAPEAVFGEDPRGWTYMNRVFTMPAGFPNVEIRHRYTADGPVTGNVYLDNIFLRELPSLSDPKWMDWLPLGSVWRYRAEAVPADWASPSFNDSAWSQGRAKFGAGAAFNVATALPARRPAYYFRRQFTAGPGAFSELLLSAAATDNYGGVIYPLRVFLNGAELPVTGIEAVSGEGNELLHYDLTPFLRRIKPGANTIAVIVSNTWAATWDNVAFDLRLRAMPSSAPASTPKFVSIQREGDGVLLRASGPPDSIWEAQFSRSIGSDALWISAGRVTLDANGRGSAQISPPGGVAAGISFYRFIPE